MTSKLQTILVLALMIGIISGLTFASILLRAESRESFDSSDGSGGSKDSDSDKGSKSNDDNSGDDSNDKSEKQEVKKESEDESDSTSNDKDTKVKSSDDVVVDDVDDEKEQAAVEDYINEEPGEKQPYPPKFVDGQRTPPIKDDDTKPEVGDTKDEWCDEGECYGPGSYGGKDTNCHGKWCEGTPEDKQRCVDNPNAEGCNEGDKQVCEKDPKNAVCHPSEDKPVRGIENIKHVGNIKCYSKYGDCGDGDDSDWCKHHNCGHGGHDDDDHRHHSNWCDHHNCHHHTHTSTSHNHDGDVTVKINTDYKETNPKNLDNVELIIGDVYDKTLDLSKKPDVIKVEHLDIDGGDDFAVCLANEDSQEGECTVVEADSDHDTVEVWLDVK